jgi:SprT-like family
LHNGSRNGVISFRCGRCTEWIKVAEAEAGRAAACYRCQHVNIVPAAEPSSPVSVPAPDEPESSSSSTPPVVWITALALIAAGIAWAIWFTREPPSARAAGSAPPTRAEALQREVVKKNLDAPGDPALNELYLDISSRHFNGTLPRIQVVWEAGLADIGALSERKVVLQGLFGNVGKRAVILLNPELQNDRPATRRVLSHEIVHAYLFSTGSTSTDHGAAFQSVLHRLSEEGAFEGIQAGEEERTALREWLDQESARLDVERVEMDRIGAQIERERVQVERTLEDLNARVTAANAQGRAGPTTRERNVVAAMRNAYNARATAANARATRNREAMEHFNAEVGRYNLMLVYPDGLAEADLIKPKTPGARAGTQ